jgi:hypothetical protein
MRYHLTLGLLALACTGRPAPAAPRSAPYLRVSTTDSAQRAQQVAHSYAFSNMYADQALLGHHNLPAGWREIRLGVDCGACVPVFEAQLLEFQGRVVLAHGLIFYSDVQSDLDQADSADRPALLADRDTVAALGRRLGCLAPWQGTSGRAVWCEVPRSLEDWSPLTAILDSVGFWRLDAPPGHDPVHRAHQSSFGGCNDILGIALEVESLDATIYRRASLACLDHPAGDPLFEAGARVAAFIHSLLWRLDAG